MKTTVTIMLFITALTSCESIKKTVRNSYQYEMYIDFKNISYQGQNRMQKLYLEIDSTNGMGYYGKLIIDNKDTIYIRGFEKGSHYVTSYKQPNSENYGRLEIWCQGETGQIRDSLTVEDVETSNRIITEKTTLYRKPRTICQ